VDGLDGVGYVRGLVSAWDERLRRDVSRFDLLAPEAIESGTLLRAPATEEDIAEAERRLRVRLPPSYRAFLLTSNGAWASSLGPETQRWGRTCRHGFVPVQEIVPVAEADPFLLEIWTTEAVFTDPHRDRPPVGDEPSDVRYYVPLHDALLISRPIDAFRDVLVPRADRDEWELWVFHKEGAGAYGSFASFLRAELAKPDLRPKPELADQYAGEAAAGHRPALMQLAELGDPRTGELALKYLLDPDVEEFFKRGWAEPLGLLADPAFVPALRRILERATIDDFRTELTTALVRCGDPDIEATRGAPASRPPT
jgi:hypothetical protein